MPHRRSDTTPTRELTRQAILADFGAFALTCGDRAALFAQVARSAVQATGMAAALVAEVRQGTGGFLVVAGEGLPPGAAGTLVLPDGAATPVGRACTAGRAVVIPDCAAEAGPDDPEPFAALGLRGIAVTPLRAGLTVVGIVALGSPEPRGYDMADLYLLEGLANMLGAGLRRMEVEAERDRLLAALREGERRYRFMTESIPQIVWTASPDGEVDYYNRRWSDYTGLSVEKGTGGEWDSAIHPDDASRTLHAWTTAVATRTPYEIEHRIRRAGGGWRWMLSRAWPLFDDAGNVVRWFGTATDIDGERQAQQALTAARDTAERANRAKSRFLAAASHDLRQPLNAISLLTCNLRTRVGDPGARELLDQIEGSLDAMIDLFESLMDISKLESGGVELDVRPVPLQPLLNRLQRDFAPAARAKGLRLGVVPTTLYGLSDPTLLERILRNLVANAVRYTDRGGVLVGVRRYGSHLRIDVVDTGPGIPAGCLDDIFEEFQQLGNAARERSSGHGLGLAIVRRAADLLQHPLDVRSRPGRGSRFSVVLPRADVVAAEPDIPAADGPAEPAATGFPILLLEDDPLVLTATRMLLEDLDCPVVEARNGDEALRIIAGGAQPRLVLADYRLPGAMDGLETVRRIRTELGRSVPAILLTGDVTADVEPRARAAGVQFVRKPVRPDELRSLVKATART
ncbi:ATP-binding protein [Rhodospirillum centenum]|uniref:histidine kinase n=1 Tax=Rhodospirillum centenum (strain ATCC 51521 / SW) TaxID=414684 RepID=B6IV95_RHOCS|nr:ATP-binding protein [Rhodospirillum centenum]ACJ00219.1 cstS1 [Rhodospirillum centenum SW]